MEPRRNPIVTVLWLMVIAVVLWFVSRVSEVIIYFAVSVALTFVLAPIVEWLVKHRVPRPLAVLSIFVVAAAVVAVGVVLVVPVAVDQLRQLVGQTTKYFQTLQDLWTRFAHAVAAEKVPDSVKQMPQKLAENLQQIGGRIASGMVHGVSKFFSTVTNLIVVPILTYYFLSDSAKIRAAFIKSVPFEWRDEVETVLTRVSAALGGFIRGQIKLCLVVGVLFGVGLAVIKLPYALLLGLIAGIVEFIPYIGPIIGCIIPLIIASFISPSMVVAVLIVFAVVQVLENNFLVPRIMGGELGLHPAMVVFILMAGGQVGGIGGMIASVPVAVIIKVLYDFFYLERVVHASEPASVADSSQPK